MDTGALVLTSGSVQPRSSATEYPFRCDSNFFYLTGLSQPDLTVILRPGHPTPWTLFTPDQDDRDILYNGRRPSLEVLAATIGADAAYATSELPQMLPTLLDGADTVYVPFAGPSAEPAVRAAIEKLYRHERDGRGAPSCLRDARVLLGEDRLIKDAAALTCLRHAVAITGMAHLAAMRATQPGLRESAIEAVLMHEFRRHGSSGPGYANIVAAGANATVLHYIANCGPLRSDDLLLVDAGGEWEQFTGDITRVWPISGRFIPAQRDLHAIVVAANEAGIALATTGSSLDAIHAAALRRMCEGLQALGLLGNASLDEIYDKQLYLRYCPHRTSHWLGADVHDLGRYLVHGVPRPLAPGHVITVEPGIYIPSDDDTAPPELRGVGIRIEDDVLVGAHGPDVLSAGIPKHAAAVEDLVGSHRA